MSNLTDKAQSFLTPTDPTGELLKRTTEDQQVQIYQERFRKKNFYERWLTITRITSVLAIALSFVSAYFSYPYVMHTLSADIPNELYRQIASVGSMGLLEVFKHSFMGLLALFLFTYKNNTVSTILGVFLFGFAALSVWCCINGVGETGHLKSEVIAQQSFATPFDKKIEGLEKDNAAIFKKHNWRGKINESSKAGTTHAKNLENIAILKSKQLESIEAQRGQAQIRNVTQTNIRMYIGYFIEGFILLCGFWGRYFQYHSAKEHSALILLKNTEQTEAPAPNEPPKTEAPTALTPPLDMAAIGDLIKKAVTEALPKPNERAVPQARRPAGFANHSKPATTPKPKPTTDDHTPKMKQNEATTHQLHATTPNYTATTPQLHEKKATTQQVLHNGKPVKRSRITSNISTYSIRLKEANTKKKPRTVVENNTGKKWYWVAKLQEYKNLNS